MPRTRPRHGRSHRERAPWRLRWGGALLVALLPVAALGAADPPEKPPAAARLIADTTAFAPGGTFRAGVLFTIDPRWHIYWHSARDGGLGTEVRWKLPAGWSAAPVEWPLPARFVLPGPLVSYGYEKEVLLTSEITVPADHSGDGPVTIAAELSWLVCSDETCKIGAGKPELVLARGAGKESADAPRFARWKGQVPVPAARAGIDVEEHFDASARSWRLVLAFPAGTAPPAAKEVRAFPFDLPGARLDEGRIEADGARLVLTFGVEISGDEFRPERLGAVLAWGARETARAIEVRPTERTTGAVRPSAGPPGQGEVARARGERTAPRTNGMVAGVSALARERK